MGGNALKNTGTRRIDAAEYAALCPELLGELQALLPSRRFEVVRSYALKPDHGDIDVLMQSDGLPADWKSLVLAHFQPREHYDNGPCFSFDYHAVQVDLIQVPGAEFDWSTRYFAFNDLGNLLGRIAHKLGLKFGHDGLWYVVRDPVTQDHVITEILVSRDWLEVLDFLGLDKAAYGDFQTLEDVFRFVRSSTYFHPDIYLLHNRNHVSRIRDKKRKTYMKFLEWCEQQPAGASYAFAEKDSYLEMIVARWPQLRGAIDAAGAEALRQREFRARYNGALLQRLSGKTGKALGEQMQHSRNSYRGDFEAFVLGASPAELEAYLRSTLLP